MSRSPVAQEENNRHSASPTDQQMKGAHQKQFRCLFPTCTHRKSGEPSFRLSPQSFRKVVRPPFDILNYTQKTRRHTNEQREHPHSEEGTPCSNCNKNRRIRHPTHSTISLTPFLPTHPSPQKSQPVHVEGKASRARLSTLCS